MANKNEQPVSFREIALFRKLMIGRIDDAVSTLRQENDVLRLVLFGLVIVLFVGYVALLVSMIGLVFAFFQGN